MIDTVLGIFLISVCALAIAVWVELFYEACKEKKANDEMKQK